MPLKPEQVASVIKSGVSAKIPDGRSLYLVTRNGRGYWVLQYRDGASFRSKGLGSAADVSPAAARRARDAFMVGRRNGALMTTVAPVVAVAGVPAQGPAAVAGMTFGEGHATYRTKHADEWSAHQQVQVERLFKNHTGPIDGIPVTSITVKQVAEVLRDKWRGPAAGQKARLRQLMEHVFRAAGVKTDDNPAKWARLQDELSKKTVKAKPHESMKADDLPVFMLELAAVNVRERKSGAGRPPSVAAADYSVVSRCLRFAILTAVRSAEAIGADWSEFNLTKREWTIPKERMKAGNEHVVPLSDAAIALLGTPKKEGSIFSVSNTRSGAINKDGLLKHLREYRNDVTVHGFRSTFATWAEDSGHKPNVIEASLAHAKGDATTKAYLRSELLPARRKLMDAWATFAAS
jgi:integrase